MVHCCNQMNLVSRTANLCLNTRAWEICQEWARIIHLPLQLRNKFVLYRNAMYFQCHILICELAKPEYLALHFREVLVKQMKSTWTEHSSPMLATSY